MIGVFDSGIGGLTALRVLMRLLPDERFVYFGDTGRVPYGTRSPERICAYAEQDLRFLLSHAPRAVLVACGTVSAIALPELKRICPVPLYGVTESAADAALRATKTRRVGITGTPATVRSGIYERILHERDAGLRTFSAACPLFVPLAESGFSADDPVTELVCERYLSPLRRAEIDTLILGCTHYPLLKAQIARTLPGVTLIDAGAEAAKTLAFALTGREENESSNLFASAGIAERLDCYVSDDPRTFAAEAERFLGAPVGNVERVTLG